MRKQNKASKSKEKDTAEGEKQPNGQVASNSSLNLLAIQKSQSGRNSMISQVNQVTLDLDDKY